MTASTTLPERIHDFLAQKRIAVCGLSRTKDTGAGAIYLKLRGQGYQVFPVHPAAEAFYGDACYPTLAAIPGGVDGVFMMTSPDVSEQIVDQALALGIRHIWMHNNTLMPSSVSKAAADRCRAAGVEPITVGCPLMFLQPDFFHKGMGWFLRVTRRLK